MPRVAIAPLLRVTRDGSRTDQDLVAVEAPLSIEISQGAAVTPLGIFMRTPGDDEPLALGLLYAEGLIRAAADVTAVTLTWDVDEVSAALRLELAPHIQVDPAALARSNVSNTACGLCGRLKDIGSHFSPVSPEGRTKMTPDVFSEMTPDVIFQLPQRLRDAQAVFAKTGGLHAAAFVDGNGQLVDVTEDVGRHNAVDKLVGRALQAGRLGAHDMLIVSGRVAYEIVQKAAMAGVRTLVAVGAPSSLAVQAARDTGIALIGFAKDGSYNVYTGADRAPR